MKSQLIQQKNMVSTYAMRGLTIVRGEGVYLIDSKDERYLDMTSNFGVSVLGHNHKGLNETLKNQIDKILNVHSSFANDTRSNAMVKLIRRLSAAGFPDLTRIFWSNSGAEAIEAAIKFAILSTGKSKFLALDNSYHGKTFCALSLTSSGERKYQKPFQNILLDVQYTEINNIEDFKNSINSDYAAFIMEPIQGEGGVIVADEDYMMEVSRICKESGVLLIIDEIQTGMGRTGKFINIEKLNNTEFSCDILCLAKGLGGGIPVGATVITDKINSQIPKGIHTSTFGGNPLAMAGVEATLQFLTDEILENASEVGDYFVSKLRYLMSDYPSIIKEVRGEGLIIGLELNENIDALEVIKNLQKNKILAAPSSGNILRFLPPLIIEKDNIDEVIRVLGEIFSNY